MPDAPRQRTAHGYETGRLARELLLVARGALVVVLFAAGLAAGAAALFWLLVGPARAGRVLPTAAFLARGGILAMVWWCGLVLSHVRAGRTTRAGPYTLGLDELIEQRKADHLRFAASADVEASAGAGWGDIRLVHEALPDFDQCAADLRVDFLGHRLAAPLLIAGMTGGHSTAREVNAVLARAAERHGLAMGIGSQRAALRKPNLAATYTVVRDHAPTAMLIGNIGAPQLIWQGKTPALSLDEIEAAVSMIRAEALAIHLNFLQEVVQPEGERAAAGIAEAIRRVVEHVRVPVVAKETGAGVSRETALRLRDLGVRALDVGGAGGTSFAAVEGLRAAAAGDARGERLGELLRDWGLPTAVSVAGARAAGLPLIATGGIRTGLDAAKALALGATLVGVARPLLQAALEGEPAVDAWIEQFLHELRSVLFLTGSQDVPALQAKPRVVSGATRAWLTQLGYL